MGKADALLAKLTAADAIKLMVLPELAFSGYMFSGRAAVASLCELAGDGSTFRWCRATAARLGCTVCCGFPRRAPAAAASGGGDVFYNSVMVVSADGLLHTHDKHHLFFVDKTWCVAGAGWSACFIPTLGASVGFGICMDINPWEFSAPFEAFELASFCRDAGVAVLAFSSAWCEAHPDDGNSDEIIVDVDEKLNYWIARLHPLIGTPAYFVCADRIGHEPFALLRLPGGGVAPVLDEELESTRLAGEQTYCGCSCVVALAGPRLVGAMNATEEGPMLAWVDIPVLGIDVESN
jgi:protein N-terminal amidase